MIQGITEGQAKRPAPFFILRPLALAVAFMLFGNHDLWAGQVSVAVNRRGDAVPGVTVMALSRPDFIAGGSKGAVAQGITDDHGLADLSVPPGRYYFVAHRATSPRSDRPAPGDYYSFYGGNPVTVGQSNQFVALSLIVIPKDGAAVQGSGGVEGVVVFEDKPLGKCYLYIYADAADGFRGLGLAVVPVGPEGRFKASLAPGRYYLIARQRREGGMQGPLKKDDKIGFYYGNPVTIRENETLSVRLEVITRLQDPEENRDEALFIRGKVKSASDMRPLAGIVVLLYADAETVGKPVAVSSPTAADGVYDLRIPSAGTYWLVAREKLGGPPQAGEWYGVAAGQDKQRRPINIDRSRSPFILDVMLTRQAESKGR